jgi:hypothetical protein
MIRLIAALVFLLSTVLVSGRAKPPEQSASNPDHVTWVAECLQRMGTIHSGMTRQQLLTVFTVEGGLSTPLHRRFVSRDCPYFKVDVTFRVLGRPERDSEGHVSGLEDPGDVIISLSKPYLQLSILD